MKITLLTDDSEELVQNEVHLYMHKKIGSVDYKRLSLFQQRHLDDFVSRHVDFSKDRTVIDLDLRLLIPQVRTLEKIADLVLIDSRSQLLADPNSTLLHWDFLRMIPWARIIVHGKTRAKILQDNGFDAKGIPFANEKFSPEPKQQNIDYGFVSRQRDTRADKPLIISLTNQYPSFFAQFALHSEYYFEILRRINIFVCAEKVSAKEYSRACYEAMSVGCVVFAKDQGQLDNEWLGLRDLHNIVLYHSENELLDKLRQVSNDASLREKIRHHGQMLMLSEYHYEATGNHLADAISLPVREKSHYPEPRFLFGIRLGRPKSPASI